MNAKAAERLNRMRNQATLYELAMTRGDERILVAYCSRKGRTDLWKAVTADHRVKRVVAKSGTETLTFAKRTADGATMGGWAIKFTGRTQRDAIAEGTLPYIGDES